MKHANGQPLPIPDRIVEQIRDEAMDLGDLELVETCKRVLAHEYTSSSDADDERYDLDLEHCWRVLDTQGAKRAQ